MGGPPCFEASHPCECTEVDDDGLSECASAAEDEPASPDAVSVLAEMRDTPCGRDGCPGFRRPVCFNFGLKSTAWCGAWLCDQHTDCDGGADLPCECSDVGGSDNSDYPSDPTSGATRAMQNTDAW